MNLTNLYYVPGLVSYVQGELLGVPDVQSLARLQLKLKVYYFKMGEICQYGELVNRRKIMMTTLEWSLNISAHLNA